MLPTVIRTQWNDLTATGRDDDMLAVAAAALRLARATPSQLTDARLNAYATGTPVANHLPEPDLRVEPDENDWLWLKTNFRTLGLKALPYDHQIAFASDLMAKTRISDQMAGLKAQALAATARVARQEPRWFAVALVALRPTRFEPRAHPALSTNPLLYGENVYMAPPVFGGRGGERLSMALADAAHTGRWRAGTVDADIWGALERMGLRAAFDE